MLQNFGIGKNMGSPTCLLSQFLSFFPMFLRAWRGADGDRQIHELLQQGLCLHHPLAKPQK